MLRDGNLHETLYLLNDRSGIRIQVSSVQSLSRVRLFMTPWIAARQASLSITNSQSSPKLMFIESVVPPAGDQPRLIQGIRRRDGVGEGQDTIASIRY